MKLSVVIPDYKDPLLLPTVNSILETSELGDQLEVIAIHDGVDPVVTLPNDPRVVSLRLEKNGGMRRAINAGVKIAKGEFLMRADEHCMFGQGFDRIMTETCQPDWIVTAIRYFLDTEKWEVMDKKPVGYERLLIQGEEVKKFTGQPWRERDNERKDIMIDETMAMQGSCWVMPHAWWDKVIGELQTEGYGPAYQDSHEMIFKTWKAGGKMMLNKNTWFAHKYRTFARTHQEGTKDNPWIRNQSWQYCIDVWKDYYDKEIKPKWNL